MKAMGSSPPGEEPMPDINSSSSADATDEEQLHDQGIWGKQKNVVEPGAYEASARAAAEAEANNEQAFENIAGAKAKTRTDRHRRVPGLHWGLPSGRAYESSHEARRSAEWVRPNRPVS